MMALRVAGRRAALATLPFHSHDGRMLRIRYQLATHQDRAMESVELDWKTSGLVFIDLQHGIVARQTGRVRKANELGLGLD